ncbi:MAG: UDP-N-acetylmuramoyl-tripeptide--D-alanyl-D-alanine ligase, partial [Actinomycetota bacterium]
MRLSLIEAARLVDGQLGDGVGKEREIGGVSIDSRQVGPGDLFVALTGDRHDGHDFVAEALAAGAAAALVSRPVPEATGPLIIVEEPLRALARLAGWVRDVIDPLVVGITGSTGKTSTKDLLTSIVAPKFRTVAARGSYNNEMGVPLTLLGMGADTEVVVCELGARGRGQISDLCRYVRPQVGIVTNVGVAHYEQFGSQATIAEAKAELPRSLPEAGTAILNADDPLVAAMASETAAEVVTFGASREALLRAERVELDGRGRARFRMVWGYEAVHVELGVSGASQVANALAACGAALALGLSLGECRDALMAATLSPWRMEVEEVKGVMLINDAYNANPASVISALETCSAMVPPDGRLIAVLGAMAELGEIEAAEHRRVGAVAASCVTRLIVVGKRAVALGLGARGAGADDVRMAPDAGAALDELEDLRPGDVVLFKG